MADGNPNPRRRMDNDEVVVADEGRVQVQRWTAPPLSPRPPGSAPLRLRHRDPRCPGTTDPMSGGLCLPSTSSNVDASMSSAAALPSIWLRGSGHGGPVPAAPPGSDPCALPCSAVGQPRSARLGPSPSRSPSRRSSWPLGRHPPSLSLPPPFSVQPALTRWCSSGAAAEYPGATACPLPSSLFSGEATTAGGCARLLGAPLTLLLSPFLKEASLRKGNDNTAGDSLSPSTPCAALVP